MTIDRELIKSMVAGKMGEGVYTLTDILSLFKEINLKISEAKLRDKLSSKAIEPSMFGLDARISGYNSIIKLYTERAAWTYLKELENERKVDLGALAINDFGDLLSRENKLRNYCANGIVIRKPILED